jgi:hypothetical protein
MRDYTINKVAWHTSVKGNPETPEQTRQRFWILTNFLQEHRLVVRHLAASIDEIGDAFEIRRSDLTPVGWDLIQRAYDRWLRSIDRGSKPTDLLLKRELSKLLSNE